MGYINRDNYNRVVIIPDMREKNKYLLDTTLNCIRKMHIKNNYEITGFDNLKKLITDMSNNEMYLFIYVLFPISGNNILGEKYGFSTDVDIRLHRVNSAFEFFTKHDFIIEEYAKAHRKENRYKQLIYCGGEMKITKIRNQIDIIINRESGTVIRCHNKHKVKIPELIREKINHDVYELRDKSFITRNPMIDAKTHDIKKRPQVYENMEYLNLLKKCGLKLGLYKEIPNVELRHYQSNKNIRDYKLL